MVLVAHVDLSTLRRAHTYEVRGQLRFMYAVPLPALSLVFTKEHPLSWWYGKLAQVAVGWASNDEVDRGGFVAMRHTKITLLRVAPPDSIATTKLSMIIRSAPQLTPVHQ